MYGRTQKCDSEIGFRLGYIVSTDITLPLKQNRVRSNIGWGIDYFLFDNYFDYKIPVNLKKWILYLGTGIGIRNWKNNSTKYRGLGIAVLYEAGIEHYYDSKITIGFDWNSYYDIIKLEYNNFGTFSLRYQFN